MTLGVSVEGPSALVAVGGEVDSTTAPLLGVELDTALDRLAGTPGAEVVIDLCEVTFLDSAGLSVLARGHRRAVSDGTRVRVLATNRAVARPLEITGLWDLLGVERI
jgi:anti-sigma B factor antagonist